MASLNKIMLIGNLGRDPEIRYLPSGEAVASFSIATTEQWKDKSGTRQERTDWHRIEFVGRTAEICGEYLKKGAPVYIEGRMQYDKWTDKEGAEKVAVKVKGDRMQMLGNGGNHAPTDEPSRDGDARSTSLPQATVARTVGAARPMRPQPLNELVDELPY